MMALVSTSNYDVSRFSLAKGRAFLSRPAILSSAFSRLDLGIDSDSLMVSPSPAPDSYSSSFGIITAIEFPTLLIFPVSTRDMSRLLHDNYVSLAIRCLELEDYGLAGVIPIFPKSVGPAHGRDHYP